MALDLSALRDYGETSDREESTSTKTGRSNWVPAKLRGRQRPTGVSSLERMRLKGSDRPAITNLDKRNDEKPKGNENKKVDRVELDVALLDDFTKSFADNKTNATGLYSLLSKEFPTVAGIISSKYYNPKYEAHIESMNKVITIMTTKLFATALLTVVKDKMIDDFDEVKSDIASVITVALDSSSNKMRDDTISLYVEIVSEHIWELEIKDMMSTIGVDEDAAIDIVLAIPTFKKKMTELQLKNAAPRFLAILVDHAETMIDTMDADNQKKLFYYIFPDIDRQALKVIGKCLSYELINQTDERVAALYNQYQRALYEMLDDNDISDIKYTLKFLVSEMARNEELHRDAPIVFDPNTAINYDNIRKAIVDLVSSDESAKKYLS